MFNHGVVKSRLDNVKHAVNHVQILLMHLSPCCHGMFHATVNTCRIHIGPACNTGHFNESASIVCDKEIMNTLLHKQLASLPLIPNFF